MFTGIVEVKLSMFSLFYEHICWKYSVYRHKKIYIIKTNIGKTGKALMDVSELDANGVDKRKRRIRGFFTCFSMLTVLGNLCIF